MLVLSRQVDESVMIAEDIEITVIEIRGNQVRLGIRAPEAIAVDRSEIYIRRQRNTGEQGLESAASRSSNT